MKSFLIFMLLMSSLSMAQNRLIFVNGKVFTVDPANPSAEAVVTEGNKIIFVGSNSQAEEYINDSSTKIDLQGKLMIPGFIDNHVHFVSGGFYLQGIDLRPAKSTSEFKRILREYAADKSGKWITGGNWDHEAWEVKDLPVKEMIDEFTQNTPVLIDRFDGHMALANSAALKIAGITKDTESPDGGLIVKDPVTGEPTGMLKDNAIQLVSRHIPVPSDEEYYAALLTALGHAKQLGVTSVQDITYWNDLKAYKRAEKDNALTCRIFTRTPIADYDRLVKDGISVPYGSDKLRMGSLKAFSDGSLGSSTAWFFDRYDQDTLTSGLAMDIVNDGSLDQWALDADKNRLQISIHAIGDKANSYVLDLYDKISKENPAWDRRFRIEHAQHVKHEDVLRFAENNVIASVQPYHLIDDGVWAGKRLGEERLKEAYPLKDFIDNGVKVCFGTDWTVAPLNPLLGIYAAVTRRTLDDKNPDGWIPEQKISVDDALKCYTINSAYASFEENIKGSIEVGKLADMVVLSEDILTIAPEKIKDVEVVTTVFDGNIIYQK